MSIITAVDTHITTTCVTLYLHRCQTHRSIAFAAPIEHLMRFWLWVRTAMPTREWVAVHRCHHANVETDKDPHSPIVYGIWRVVLFGTGLYHRAAHNKDIVEQYGKGTPDDFLELFYDRLSITGPVVTLVTNVWLFGTAGLAMWLVEMAWIPFFAAGVINGLGHFWGYRNFETPDASTQPAGAALVAADRRRGAAQQPPSHPERSALFDEEGRDRPGLPVLQHPQGRRAGKPAARHGRCVEGAADSRVTG